MEKNFDFNEVGKRMPYTVPDGFFDQLEENVLESLKADQPSSSAATNAPSPWKRKVSYLLLAAAAAAALFLVMEATLFKSEPMTDCFESVEQAFNGLSIDDQDYLLAVYEEDLFINETDNLEEL